MKVIDHAQLDVKRSLALHMLLNLYESWAFWQYNKLPVNFEDLVRKKSIEFLLKVSWHEFFCLIFLLTLTELFVLISNH